MQEGGRNREFRTQRSRIAFKSVENRDDSQEATITNFRESVWRATRKNQILVTLRAGGVPGDLPGVPGHPLRSRSRFFIVLLSSPGRLLRAFGVTLGSLDAPVSALGRKKTESGPYRVLQAIRHAKNESPGTSKCYGSIVNSRFFVREPRSRIFTKKGAPGIPKRPFGITFDVFGRLGARSGRLCARRGD